MKLITYTTKESRRIPYMIADGDDELDRIIGRLIREVKPIPEQAQVWQLRSDDAAYLLRDIDLQ